jgi:hypothetical protein
MIKTYFLNAQKLPLVVESDNSDKSLGKLSDLAAQRDFFGASLLRHGAVLLRGFEIRAIEEFENFVRVFSGKDFFNYAGGSFAASGFKRRRLHFNRISAAFGARPS